MKTKINLRTVGNSKVNGDQNGKGKRLTPEKKVKNDKRALYQEIEEDEEIDYLNLKRNGDSIEDYYDDDNEYLNDGEEEDDNFEDEGDDEDDEN